MKGLRLVAVVLAVSVAMIYASKNSIYTDVKIGAKDLFCNGSYVSPDKIEGFIDDTWLFNNGQAKNCEVK